VTTTQEHSSARLPSKIMLKSFHGKYVAAEPSGHMVANRNWADDWEKFDVLPKGTATVALRSFHGKFVSANANGMMRNTERSSDSDDTSFEVTFAASGALVLKSFHGKYVSAHAWTSALTADKKDFDDWEEFEVIDLADRWPSYLSIKSAQGLYLRGYPDGHVAADGWWPLDSWERFGITHNVDGTVSLRCDHGEYISVQPDGSLHTRKQSEGTEKFAVTHLDDGNFTMQDHTGRYLWSSRNGALNAQHTAATSSWERKFQVVFLF